MTTTPAPVRIHLSPDERALLKAAAARARTSLSDYIRRTALEAAELELMDRREVIIPAADWDRFEAWAEAPGRSVPALVELAGD